jgi:hypothetical protein
LSWPIVGAFAQSAPTIEATALPTTFSWSTVANSATVIPNGDGRLFNSFNQPSVNSTGLVALRARSKGGGTLGEPLRGIYSRQMGAAASTLTVEYEDRERDPGRRPGPVAGTLMVAYGTTTEVPQPNNTSYSGKLSTLTEFPAFPRIGLTNSTILTRGQSKPVWTYTLADGSESRTGTSGVYALRAGEKVSAMTQLGAVTGFEHFSVPGAAAGTKFDQFPGSPAVANTNAAVFKGNYVDGTTPKTGIFFRSFNSRNLTSKTQVIASSDTVIPGQTTMRFGSTAPPSASDSDAVFLGLDNEESPTTGGIYRAPLKSTPQLKTLVRIGGQVPGELTGVNFNRLGEALSYDGRFVAFWGGWGASYRDVTLNCPSDGQSAVIAFCKEKYPSGYTVQVPTNQGFFVHDTETRKTHAVVKTGTEYLDFLYWTFSGRPPGVGDSDSEDFEDPRWRSASFVATYKMRDDAQVAFKGRKLSLNDGIYLTSTPTPATKRVIRTLVETGMDGSTIDPQASGIPIISVGLERDGLRNGWLAIAASMANASTGWAGVYVARTVK